MADIDFWFSIGSTYTFLTVQRVTELAEAHGVTVRWRPFNVRAVMIAQDNIPFANKPVKSAYMWRDIERRAKRYGLEARLPAPYPLEHLERANRVALVGAREGWVEPYVIESYRLWFGEGLPAGSEPNLSRSLCAAGQEPSHVLSRADSTDTGKSLESETAEAMRLGVFGAPSFVVGREVFWGDDRLEDAIDWWRNPFLP